MANSQIQAPSDYGRRIAVSLAIAVCAHLLLLLVPIYRLIGTHPGNAGGSSGLSNPFSGALLGSSVIIRAAETASQAQQPATVADKRTTTTEDLSVPRLLPESADRSEPLDDENLAVDLLPPTTRQGGSSANNADTNGGASPVFGGSMKPLGGGGGVAIEMDLEVKTMVWPDPLSKIVVKRKIEGQVIVQALVDLDGLVLDHRVLRSIPDCPECTASAVQAVLAYEFLPPVFEDQPVRAWVRVPIDFGTRH